jgi:iron complex transport system substrate-binding protein
MAAREKALGAPARGRGTARAAVRLAAVRLAAVCLAAVCLAAVCPAALGPTTPSVVPASTVASVRASTIRAQPPSPPSRIVSLVPAATEMLFALGVGAHVVGVSSFDRFPPEVAAIPRVGALLDPDVERILSLRPDLVIVYGTQKDLRTQLARAQVAIYPYSHAGLADVTETIRRLGEQVGAAGTARTLASSIEARIAAVRARTAGLTAPRTLVVFGRDSFSLRGIYASGGVGFIHDMVTAAGGTNVLADMKREAVQATTELVLVRRPDIIIELRADPIDPATEARELRTWAALSSVPAVRNGRVHIVADPRTVIPGPRVAEGVELLFRVLHDTK